MKFPKEAVRACDELAALYPDMAMSAEDSDRRRLTRMIAEQIAYERGNRWGCKKRAGVGDDYQSKDSIAYRESDETTSVWDWQNGTTRKRSVDEGSEPTHSRLPDSEAKFMAVTPTDHLGWGKTPPAPPEPPPATEPVTDLSEIAAFIKEVRSFTTDVRASLGEMHRKVEELRAQAEQKPHVPEPAPIKWVAYETKVPLIGTVYSVPKTD